MECHGCQGRGWVETAGGVMVHICPICKGSGWLPVVIDATTNTVVQKDEENETKSNK